MAGGGDHEEEESLLASYSAPPDRPQANGTFGHPQRRTKHGKPLSLVSKVCFALGGMPYQMTNNVIGFFISIFLLEVAQIRPAYASVILFGGRAWDAITDPLVGFLVSKTNTRWGKLRPWIIFSAPFGVASYFFLWYVPADFSEEARLGWYFLMYCLFEAALSCFHVPYTALTIYLSADPKERDSATAYRMFCEVLGVLLGSAIQGQIVAGIGGSTEKDCNNPGATVSPEAKANLEKAYLVGAGVMCGFYLLCAATVFFGVKERKDVEGGSEEEEASFFEGLKLVFKHGPYVKLTMSFLFLSLAIQSVQGNFALFCQHALGLGDQFQNLIIALLGAAILCMPVWQWCLVKYGKKTALFWGTAVFIPTLFTLLYIPGNPYAVYPITILGGVGISVAFLLPWSMLPDVVDDFTLKTGTRREAIFYSFYVFFTKFAAGISLGLSTLSLEAAGYVTGACSQSAIVGFTLRMLVAPAPIVFIIISLLFLWSYPITEERRRVTKAALEHKRDKTRRNGQPDALESSLEGSTRV
ncbi:sodium-dependent lysophosphatidylcholine symporter 1-B-like [Branchiostoma floridae x Branchiostoma japonicum]